jgi:hypothetical protein
MKRLALAALIAFGAASAPLSSMAASNVSLFIGTAPPPLLVERMPAPRHGYVWAPGHWEWGGHRHVWAPGYWVAERPGYVYNAPVWAARNGGWYMEPARWTPYDNGYGGGYRGGRDRDRDGIPDRYEHGGYGRGPDRDRDGDGVPNRVDRRPDNAWRR